MDLRILSLFCAILLLSSANGRQLEEETNICDRNNRDTVILCYCRESIALQNASHAECWILNGNLTHDDAYWSSFSTQTNLIELNFNVRSDSGLNFIPTKGLKYLRYLKHLTIQYATIEEMTPYAFANLTSLKEVTVEKNKIVHLREYAVSFLPNLMSLSLEGNKIIELRRNVFYELPSLQKLFLSGNNISVVHERAFKHLTQLQELKLDKNSITTLTRESFDGLANLRKLDLQQNRLNMLGDLTFAELRNLQELLLEGNALQLIAKRAFDGLSQLKMLSLSENKLKTLTNGIFEGVKGLFSLDLRKNHLETLTFENIRPLIDNLKIISSSLYLEENPFECDCRLSWMHMLRDDTKSDKVRESLEKVICRLEPDKKLEENQSRDKKQLFAIPMDHLPCPESMQNSTHAPRTTTQPTTTQPTTTTTVKNNSDRNICGILTILSILTCLIH